MTELHFLPRRVVLQLLGAAALGLPRLALAEAATENRLVVVIQRGAMDALAVVPPYGDAHYTERRAGLVLPPPGETDGMVRLDATFGLHPTLAPQGALWPQRQLLIVPATAGGYQTRSHFDAQDLLESGLIERRGALTGWLNRALARIPAPADRRLGLVLGATVPLTLRGRIPVASWEPPDLAPASPSLLALLGPLYAADPLLGPALADGIKAQSESDMVMGTDAKGMDGKPGGPFRLLAEAAGRMLAAPDGPRIAVLDIGGWDTHSGQGTVKGRLTNTLASFSQGLEALRTSLGSAWDRTVVVTVTEFGRTVRPNGTGGTDHGTASATLLLGGAVQGGKIAGDWPGLATLLEDRDLRPATELRAVLKGVLRDHLGIDRATLAAEVFPDSGAIRPMDGLIRA